MPILFGMLSVVWLFSAPFIAQRYCPCDQKTAAASSAQLGGAATGDALFIADQKNNFKVSASENLIFPTGICAFFMPLPEAVDEAFYSLANHLKAHPGRILVVEGAYHSSEENSCKNDPNLGLARSKVMVDHLVALGISQKQMRLVAKEKPLRIQDGQVYGGMSFRIIGGTSPEIEARLRKNKMVFQFEKNEMNLELDAWQQNYFEDMKQYLSQNPKAKVLVGGHTDDKGKPAWNKRLSRKRAQFVAEFMNENGISSRNLLVTGHGPDQPISPNDSEENRQKNRRVEVTIQ